MQESTKKLVYALEQEYLLTGDQRLKQIIFRAKSDYYHDYVGVPAMPEIELYHELRTLGHRALANRVESGEFDATKEESDAWARSPEGQSLFRKLLNDKGK
jgi:hypothetical protein